MENAKKFKNEKLNKKISSQTKMSKKVKINIDGKIRSYNLLRPNGGINQTVRKYVKQFGTKSRGKNSISGLNKSVFLYKKGDTWDIGKVNTKGKKHKKPSNLKQFYKNYDVRNKLTDTSIKTFGGVKVDKKTGNFLSSAQATAGFTKGKGAFVNEPSGTMSVPKPVRTTQLQGSKFLRSFRYQFRGALTRKQMYAFYKKEVLNRGLFADLVLYAKTGRNKVANITIDQQYFTDFETFDARISAIEDGAGSGDTTTGSDAFFGNTDYDWDMSVIDLRFASGENPAEVNGDPKNIIYEVEGVEGRGLCGHKSMVRILGADKVNTYMTSQAINEHAFKSLDCIRHCLQSYNISHKIYANAVHIPHQKDNNGVFNDRFLFQRQRTKIMVGKKEISAVRIYQEDTIPNVIASFGDNNFINLMVDTSGKENHIDLCKDNRLTLCDDIYFMKNKIYKKLPKGSYKYVFNRSMANNVSSEKKVEDMRLIFFDCETVVEVDENNFMKCYSVAYTVFSVDDLAKLDLAEKDNTDITSILRGKSDCFVGWDSMEKFVDMVSQLPDRYKYKLVGFNNSNFDNFLLADYLYTTQNTTKNKYGYSISKPFYNGTSLMNLTMNGRINCFDLARHITGTSLKGCCKNFNVKHLAKKELNIPVPSHPHLKSHAAIQKIYEIGLANHNPNYLIELLEDKKHREALVSYNVYDVVSLAVCFCRYRDALSGVPTLKSYAKEIWDNMTIGGITWNMFSKSCERSGITWGKLTEEQYNYTLADSVAGRVQMFNGPCRYTIKMTSQDVCSLYPYICAVNNEAWFPTGDKVDVDYEAIGGLNNQQYRESEIWDKIGFYKCDVDQTNLQELNKVAIYPLKKRNEAGMVQENLWDLDDCGEMYNVCLSSVTIKQMIDADCKVCIKYGYYFEGKIEGHKLFPFVLDFMKGKNEQDIYKKNGDKRYNASLRTAFKLFPNALTGKVIEGLHRDTIAQVDNEEDFYKIKDKYENTSVINQIGDAIFVSYTKPVSEVIHKQRPIFLGRLIYDYAKKYMWDNIYYVGKDKCVYTDTDSCKMTALDNEMWKIDARKKIVPHWDIVEQYDPRYKDHPLYSEHTKVFGSFEDEFDLDDAKIDEKTIEAYEYIQVQKKAYLYNLKINGEWINNSDWFRFKGVRPNSILMDIDDLPNFCELNEVNHIDGRITRKHRVKRDINISIMTDYVNNNQDKQVINNSIKFFRGLYVEKKALVLCNSFRKIVKATTINHTLGEGVYQENNNKIELCYSLKNLRM